MSHIDKGHGKTFLHQVLCHLKTDKASAYYNCLFAVFDIASHIDRIFGNTHGKYAVKLGAGNRRNNRALRQRQLPGYHKTPARRER